MEQKDQYPNVTIRKYTMKEIVNSLIKSRVNRFFHSNEINQNPAVVPGNRSYGSTTKYGRRVIVFGDITWCILTEKFLVVPYKNFEAA